MIGSSKNNRENYPTKCFWMPEKETWVKFNPGWSTNWLSNNWALWGVELLQKWGNMSYRGCWLMYWPISQSTYRSPYGLSVSQVSVQSQRGHGSQPIQSMGQQLVITLPTHHKDFFGFCSKSSLGIFGVLIFAPFWSSLSLETWSTPLGNTLLCF